MNKEKFIHWSGLAAILAGILVVINQFMGNGLTWLYIFENALLIMALTGIYLFQYEEAGFSGKAGYIFAMAGIFLFVFDFWAEILVFLGALILSIGLILLAAGALKAKKIPHWVSFLWILAPFIGIPGFIWETLDVSAIWITASAFFALGFIGAGYRLWRPV